MRMPYMTLSGNGRDRSKFTIDYLQQYAVDKKNMRNKWFAMARSLPLRPDFFQRAENILNSQVVSEYITVTKELIAQSDSTRFLIYRHYKRKQT